MFPPLIAAVGGATFLIFAALIIATFQARAFLDQAAGVPDPLPACTTSAGALRTMKIIQAVVESSRDVGAAVTGPPAGTDLRRGQHRRLHPGTALSVDLLLSSATAGKRYLAVFADRGMELTGLNRNDKSMGHEVFELT